MAFSGWSLYLASAGMTNAGTISSGPGRRLHRGQCLLDGCREAAQRRDPEDRHRTRPPAWRVRQSSTRQVSLRREPVEAGVPQQRWDVHQRQRTERGSGNANDGQRQLRAASPGGPDGLRRAEPHPAERVCTAILTKREGKCRQVQRRCWLPRPVGNLRHEHVGERAGPVQSRRRCRARISTCSARGPRSDGCRACGWWAQRLPAVVPLVWASRVRSTSSLTPGAGCSSPSSTATRSRSCARSSAWPSTTGVTGRAT